MIRSQEEQAKFVKSKYEKCSWLDEEVLEDALDLARVRARAIWVSDGSDLDLSQRSGLSLSSNLDGSSCFSLFDLVDDEEFYLACARTTTSCPPPKHAHQQPNQKQKRPSARGQSLVARTNHKPKSPPISTISVSPAAA